MADYFFYKRDQSPGITWERLHNEICRNAGLCNTPLGQQRFMDRMFMRLPSPQSETPVKGKLYITAFAPKGGLTSSSVKKYSGYMYHGDDRIQSRQKSVRDYLLKQKNPSGESWDYKTHPEILAFKSIWEELVPSSSGKEYNECLYMSLDEMLVCIPNNTLQIVERLSALLDACEYSLTLAILSVIASTLFCFGCGDEPLSEKDYELQALVLPPVPKRTISAELENARSFVENKKGSLDELYMILKIPLKKEKEQGDAYYLLARYAFEISRGRELTDRERKAYSKRFEDYLKQAIRCGNLKAIRLGNEKKAVELLYYARSVFNGIDQSNPIAVKKCCDNCQQILSFSPSVDAKFRGEASYILYRYIRSGLYVSPTGETSLDYLGLSHRLGYSLAKEEWTASNTFSIAPQYERPAEEGTGVCYTNADNIISDTFAKTIPDSWGAAFQAFDRKAVSEILYENDHRRFLFIDDCYQKNLKDFLTLLQLIKDSAPESVDHFEIFLRYEFESGKPLIDTALNHLSGYRIAVYLLDDDKIAAEQLLSFHPLFYPLKSFDFNLLEKLTKQDEHVKQKDTQNSFKRPVLNFIIFGNTNVAEWLVREAFWMMGFKNNLIDNRITILADHAEEFEVAIKSKYPGMIKRNLEIDGIEFPTIKGINVNYATPEFLKIVEKELNRSRYNYIAVATDSDEDNLSLAMKLRELLIRSCVSDKRKQELIVSSPIAFLCKNDNLAWISKNMVVEHEEEGDRWFNSWNLIPFGEISSRYSFQNITGGTFEKLARCIHYQYSNVSPDAAYRQTEEWKEATKEYYLKQYNQDSSYSAALSMPYRVFQFQDRSGHQIIPSAWNICQPTVFSSVDQLNALSKRMWSFVNSSHREEQEQAIAKWAHARWVKWMISRGWMPATMEEVLFAFEQGNPRQQLFIAKLHPCICSYQDLKRVQDELWTRCHMEKDFFSNDLLNIQDTLKLLALEWIITPDKEKER